MATRTGSKPKPLTLGEAMAQRMAQLGMSKRALAARTGLSRQTINNAEHNRVVTGHTLACLDEGLYWKPGTALALVKGDDSLLKEADLLIKEEDGSTTRWALVMRVSKLSLDDLQQLTAYLDTHLDGHDGHHNGDGH